MAATEKTRPADMAAELRREAPALVQAMREWIDDDGLVIEGIPCGLLGGLRRRGLVDCATKVADGCPLTKLGRETRALLD